MLRARNMTQRDLAARMGVSTVSLNKMLKGNPTIPRLEQIAQILNVRVSDLLDEGQPVNIPQPERPALNIIGKFRCPKCGAQLSIIPTPSRREK